MRITTPPLETSSLFRPVWQSLVIKVGIECAPSVLDGLRRLSDRKKYFKYFYSGINYI